MNAETLWIALVVVVGATIFSMVREFLREPWYLQESLVIVESTGHDQITYMQPGVAYAQPQTVPGNVYALPAMGRPVDRASWLDSTQPLPKTDPESVPA